MSDPLAFSLLAIPFIGYLAWGLKTGDMPMKYSSIARDESPRLFWAAAAFNGIIALVCVAVAIRTGLSNT